MAQNVVINGVTYQAVPEVDIPKSGGGTASFTDVTDTTATASNVASGTYFYTAAGVKTEGTIVDGNSLSYGITDGTIPKVGIAKAGYAEI